MSTTADKIKRSRQKIVAIAGHNLTIRRPTPVEFMACPMQWLAGMPAGLDKTESSRWVAEQINLRSDKWREAALYMLRHFVDGWDLQEIDLIPGGTATPEPFDAAVLELWLQDRPDALNELALAIFNEAFAYYEKYLPDAEKKSVSGSNPEN